MVVKNWFSDMRHQRTGSSSAIYYLVALYLGYLGYSIMNNRLSGDDTMSYPLAIIFTCIFIIAAVFIAFYATKQIRNEIKTEKDAAGKKEENN